MCPVTIMIQAVVLGTNLRRSSSIQLTEYNSPSTNSWQNHRYCEPHKPGTSLAPTLPPTLPLIMNTLDNLTSRQ